MFCPKASFEKGYNYYMAITNVAKKSKRGASKGERRGGRQKGTPNKRTLDFIEALGSFDPVRALIELYERTEDDGIKLGALKEMLKYLYPQRKAIESVETRSELPEININGVSI